LLHCASSIKNNLGGAGQGGGQGQGVWPVAQCRALIIGKVKNNLPAGVFVALGMQHPMLSSLADYCFCLLRSPLAALQKFF